ncbi:MAG: tetraacyldisaccharide 4'-kinase [Pseudomonadota bacterium]
MTPPRFWQRKNAWQGICLAPLGWLYGLIVEARFFFSKPRHVGIPIICIGNFTLGGTGKTPAAIYTAQRLKMIGLNAFVLSRGYGGKIKGPHRVDIDKDNAESVGDEALLLARHAPTIIARDRFAGARHAVMQGAGVLVMDDGMQNPSLEKNLTLALVDAQNPTGNGFIFPAGPLRGFLNLQSKRADAVLKIGGNGIKMKHDLSGSLQPQNGEWLKDKRVLGFCGIGNPEKFRATLKSLGADVVRFEIFPDHYMFEAGDANRLIAEAARDNLMLVTTEKDNVRLQSFYETRAQLAGLTNVLAIKFVPDDEAAFDRLLRGALSRPGGA